MSQMCCGRWKYDEDENEFDNSCYVATESFPLSIYQNHCSERLLNLHFRWNKLIWYSSDVMCDVTNRDEYSALHRQRQPIDCSFWPFFTRKMNGNEWRKFKTKYFPSRHHSNAVPFGCFSCFGQFLYAPSEKSVSSRYQSESKTKMHTWENLWSLFSTDWGMQCTGRLRGKSKSKRKNYAGANDFANKESVKVYPFARLLRVNSYRVFVLCEISLR